MKDYFQDSKGTMVFSACGIDCTCIVNENGLPDFEVVGYTDKDNISFRYEKGDILKPDINNNAYCELLMSVEGEEAAKWKSRLMTSFIIYATIERLDNMSFMTLKEVREGLNKRLQSLS